MTKSESQEFYLIGSVTAKPGLRSKLEQQLRSAAKILTDAPGLRSWTILRDPDNDDTVWVTEAWESPAAHEASLQIPGIPEIISQAMPLMAHPPEPGKRLKPIAGAGCQCILGLPQAT